MAGVGQHQNDDHCDWVRSLLTECRSIREGLTRKQILERFAPSSVEQFRGVILVHRQCGNLETSVDFQPVGGAVFDAQQQLTNQPTLSDIVWRTSRPWLCGHETSQWQTPLRHNAWLQSIIRDWYWVRRGTTRAELFHTFGYAGGVSGIFTQERFAHQACGEIQLEVSFWPKGGPRFDGEGRIVNMQHPQDRIWDCSRLFLDWEIFD